MRGRLAKGFRNLAGTVLVWMVRGYQVFISPALRPSCKYYPSCSQYAIDALRQYGFFRGVVMAGWRLLRCNPLSYGGYDPVERQTLFVPRTDRHLQEGPHSGCDCGGGHHTLGCRTARY